MTIHDEIEAELARALAKYPDCERLSDGTGASGYRTFEAIARQSCERAYREGRITHAHIFEEETAEVLAAADPAAIRKELVQVGAMTLKWIRDIDARTADCQGTTGEAPKVEDQRASDPVEAKDPGNGQRNTADPSASGNPPTEPAGRRDLRAPQKTEESPQGEVGRPAEGGNALTFALFSKANRLRCERDFGERLGPESSHGPADWVLNVVEEVGEIAKAVLGVTGKKKRKAHLTIEDIGEEIADTVTYLDLLASYYDLSLGTLVMEKFNRVSDRIGSKIKIRAGDTASPAPDVSMCSPDCGKKYGGTGSSSTIFCTPACCSSGRSLRPVVSPPPDVPAVASDGRKAKQTLIERLRDLSRDLADESKWHEIRFETNGRLVENYRVYSLPVPEQAPTPSSSESLTVAGTCDVCGQVYQGHPNRHAMCEGKVAAPQAEVPRCFIRNCPTHRPLNPAPEVQPVPAGFRLGDGWVAGGALHPGGYTAVYCDMLHMAEAVYVRRNEDGYIVEGACRDHAIATGALVPIVPPVPAGYEQGQRDFQERAARACSFETYRNGGVDCRYARLVRSLSILTPDGSARDLGRALVPIEPTAAPEGQQGDAKASEHTCCAAKGSKGCRACELGLPDSRLHIPAWATPAAPDVLSALDAGTQPAAPTEVSESGKVPLSERVRRMDRGIDDDEVPALANEIAALEGELVYANGAADRWASEAASRASAHVDAAAERDAARAEVERLRGKLDAADADNLSACREADAREAAMRSAAYRQGWADGSKTTREAVLALHANERRPYAAGLNGSIDDQIRALKVPAPAIERLPLSTGEAQPDAIKAAVTAANNRAADAFHDWISDVAGRAAANDFEEWLRSGDPAPGTVGGGK